MAEITHTFEVKPVALEEHTNLSKCTCCNDIIYGKMFRIWLATSSNNGKTKHGISPSEIVLCEACNGLTQIGIGE